MSEEESDGTFTDSQAEEEGELPVIQLCGLVEELRYRPPPWTSAVSVVAYRPLNVYAEPRRDTSHYNGERICVCLVSLAACLLLN